MTQLVIWKIPSNRSEGLLGWDYYLGDLLLASWRWREGKDGQLELLAWGQTYQPGLARAELKLVEMLEAGEERLEVEIREPKLALGIWRPKPPEPGKAPTEKLSLETYLKLHEG